MKHPVVKLVGEALVRFQEISALNPALFPEGTTLYPVPFFGDIRRATVLTLSLNPARTEFDSNRRWMPGLDEYALTSRLLHYFDLPQPGPHRWFGQLESSLAAIDCSYQTNTAHIDLCPLPTKFRRELDEGSQSYLGHLIENHSVLHLDGLLAVASNVKLILVIDYTFTRSSGLTTTTSGFIRSSQPVLNALQPKGRQVKIVYTRGVQEFENSIQANQELILSHLARTTKRD